MPLLCLHQGTEMVEEQVTLSHLCALCILGPCRVAVIYPLLPMAPENQKVAVAWYVLTTSLICLADEAKIM